MGKMTSLMGKVNGKIGAVVYSTTSGQIIAREYNPNVKNPNTISQVNQRARLKLMSQMAAILAPVIVIPREGLKSSRNLFIKKNMDYCYASGGVAQITYENVQLTTGNSVLPALNITRSEADGIKVALQSDASASVTRVVYCLYQKTSASTLQYVGSKIAKQAGEGGLFPASFAKIDGDIVVFAYGMIDLNGAASVQYGNLNVKSAKDIAELVMTRKLASGSFQFTETRGATLFANESQNVQVPEGSARVFVTATGGGTATGSGIFTIGENVTVKATPDNDHKFVAWRLNGSDKNLSTANEYTFKLEGQTDLVAVFASKGGSIVDGTDEG